MIHNAETDRANEDDFTHYFNAVVRLTAENKRLRRELDDLRDGRHPTHRLIRIDGNEESV